MNATRTQTWSSLYEFSAAAAAEVIDLFNLSVVGKGYPCTFNEALQTFKIICSADDETVCMENFHAIITDYIARYLNQRTEPNGQRKVSRIEATCFSEQAIEEEDEDLSTTQDTASVTTATENVADAEFAMDWKVADIDQSLANTFLSDSIKLVLEVVGRTFCVAQTDMEQGVVTISGNDASAILKIVGKLDNLAKHYLRMKRNPEVHLVEIEDEEKEKYQLKFNRLLDFGKKSRTSRTTLLPDSHTWSWLSQLHVARLLPWDQEQDATFFIRPDVKPLRQVDPLETPRLWKGYTYMCCGDSYHVAKMRRARPQMNASSQSTQSSSNGTEVGAVQKWVSEVAIETAHEPSSDADQTLIAGSPDGLRSLVGTPKPSPIGSVSGDPPGIATKVDIQAPRIHPLRRRRPRDTPQSQVLSLAENQPDAPVMVSPPIADENGNLDGKGEFQSKLVDEISSETLETNCADSELLVVIEQHCGNNDKGSKPVPAGLVATKTNDTTAGFSFMDLVDSMDLPDTLVEPLKPTYGAASPASASELGDTLEQSAEHAQSLISSNPTVEIPEHSQNLSQAPEDLLQLVSEIDTRVFKQTMKQQKGKSSEPLSLAKTKGGDEGSTSTSNSSQTINGGRCGPNSSIHESNVLKLNDRAKHALRNAIGFRGTVKLEVNIGRILVHDLPDKYTKDAFGLEEWEDILFTGAIEDNKKNTTFTSRLTTSFIDAESMVDLSVNGSRVFNSSPYQSTVHYKFHCRLGEIVDDEFNIEINAETLEWTVTKPTEPLGQIYFHYPKRAWDSKIAVTGTECSPKYEAVAKQLIHSIYIPIGKSSITMTYTVPERNLEVTRVLVKRETRYSTSSTAHDNLALCQIEVQDLHIAHAVGSEGIFRAFAGTRSDMVASNRLWYRVSIICLEVEDMFVENQEMELGDEASWDPKKITEDKIVESLQQLSRTLVTNIDHVGYYNISEQWLEHEG